MIRTQNMSLPVIYLAAVAFFALSMDGLAAGGSGPLLNEPVDVSPDFYDFTNLYYLADKLSDFDPAAGTGKLTGKGPSILPARPSITWRRESRPWDPTNFPAMNTKPTPCCRFRSSSYRPTRCGFGQRPDWTSSRKKTRSCSSPAKPPGTIPGNMKKSTAATAIPTPAAR